VPSEPAFEQFTTDYRGQRRLRCQAPVLRTWWQRKGGESPVGQCAKIARYEDHLGRPVCAIHEPALRERRLLAQGVDPDAAEERRIERFAAAIRRAPLEDAAFYSTPTPAGTKEQSAMPDHRDDADERLEAALRDLERAAKMLRRARTATDPATVAGLRDRSHAIAAIAEAAYIAVREIEWNAGIPEAPAEALAAAAAWAREHRPHPRPGSGPDPADVAARLRVPLVTKETP
jgi:hypothetical protein